MSIHPWAREGFARAAAEYERARPAYPAAVVAYLAHELRLGSGATVVELGAGTGKLSRLLATTGARVLAVEPLAAMRSLVPREVETLDGTAEAIPLPTATADAVVAAQAFQWFDAEAALAETHRVLRPGGRLAILENCRDPGDEVQRAFEALLARHRCHPPLPHAPRFDAGPFQLVELRSFEHTHELAREDLTALAASETSIALLETAAHATALADFEQLAARLPPRVRLRYTTQVLIAGSTCSSSAP